MTDVPVGMCNIAAAVATCQPDIANERNYILEFRQRWKEKSLSLDADCCLTSKLFPGLGKQVSGLLNIHLCDRRKRKRSRSSVMGPQLCVLESADCAGREVMRRKNEGMWQREMGLSSGPVELLFMSRFLLNEGFSCLL